VCYTAELETKLQNSALSAELKQQHTQKNLRPHYLKKKSLED